MVCSEEKLRQRRMRGEFILTIISGFSAECAKLDVIFAHQLHH